VSSKVKEEFRHALRQKFPQVSFSLFEGSDWNHHSYQAAFCDPHTLYVILTKHTYNCDVERMAFETAQKNTRVLRAISFATYTTIQDKAVYFSF